MQGLHPDLLKAGLDFATKNPAAAASFAKDAMQPQGQKTGAPETAPGTEAGPEAGPGPTAAAEGEPGTQPPPWRRSRASGRPASRSRIICPANG